MANLSTFYQYFLEITSDRFLSSERRQSEWISWYKVSFGKCWWYRRRKKKQILQTNLLFTAQRKILTSKSSRARIRPISMRARHVAQKPQISLLQELISVAFSSTHIYVIDKTQQYCETPLIHNSTEVTVANALSPYQTHISPFSPNLWFWPFVLRKIWV